MNLYYIVSVLYAALVFSLDLMVPLGVAAGVPYVALVLIGVWLPKPAHTYYLAAAGSLLTVLGYLLSAEGGVAWMVVVNRGLALFAIWVAGLLIASRKQYENAFLQARERLEEAQRIARLGNWSLDTASGRLTWSEEVYRIFGVTRNFFQPTHDHQMSMVHHDDQRVVRERFDVALETGRPYEMEYRILRKDTGEIRWVHERCEHLRNPAGDIIRSAGTVQDVTKRKQDEEALEKETMALLNAEKALKEQAESVNNAKSMFLSTMSHELRTPLNAIIGFSEMMKEEILGPVQPAQYAAYISDIHNSSLHLMTLINDILDMSTIEAGQLAVKLERLCLPDVIGDTTAMLSPLLEGKSLTLETDIPAVPIPVRADLRFTRQILINLLDNAIKFSHRGKVVTVRARAVDGMAEIRVIDTGIGIAKENIGKAFQPFVQMEREEQNTFHQGTGLGLSLSRRFAELQHGTLALESEAGKGTTAVLRIPLDSQPLSA